MPSLMMMSFRKRLRRIGYALLVLFIVIVPVSRTLLASLIPSAIAASGSNNAKAGTAKPTNPSTASSQTPKTKPRH